MKNDNMNAPEIRFPGFTDPWEQRKLGDVVGVYDGTHQTPDYKDQGVMFVSVENIQTLTSDKYISEEDYEKNYSVVPEVGDILMTRIGDIGTANIVKSPEPLAYYVSLALLKNAKLNAEYLKSNISAPAFQNELWLRTLHTAYPKKINKEEIGKCMISIAPQKREQEQIGCFFENLDNLITLHQRKCDELKIYKKGLLQQMFPQPGEAFPHVRFPGFTDPWEQRKLRDLIIEYKETVDADCTLPILTSSKTEGVVLQEDHFGSKQRHDITGYNILPRGYCTYRNRSDGVDFTFNINKCCDKGIISKFYPVFYGNNNNIHFISLVLNHSDEVVHEIGYTCIGTGQKVLSFTDLQKMNIRIPCLQEQDRISKLFESIDNTITLHQRKCDELKNYKKGLLQKMFV